MKPDKEKKNSSDLSGLKILLAEDDPLSADLIKTYLRNVVGEILFASTGIEAIDLARSVRDIDIILMDIKMPLCDGYKATRQIRQFNSEVVIIAQTAYALEGDRDKALDAGCNDYITKPVKRGELISLMRQLLE